MGWFYSATQPLQLIVPQHDNRCLPVPMGGRRAPSGRVSSARLAARTSLQVVAEFRNKMKMAEELISKLAFSLREIQGLRRRQAAPQGAPPQKTEVVRLDLNRAGK